MIRSSDPRDHAVQPRRSLTPDSGSCEPAREIPGATNVCGPGRPPGPPQRITQCPLDPRWRRWSFFALYSPGSPFRLADDVRKQLAERFEAGTLEDRLECPQLHWEIAADDTSLQPLQVDRGEEPARFKNGCPSHVHGELSIAGHEVHIDGVAALCYGPGASYVEIRVYVDGRLAGVGSRGGCALGFGVGWPRDAAAVIDDRHAIIVRDRRVGSERDARSARLAVELWRRRVRV